MAQQTINIGIAPNDGTGDPLRSAFDKCNDNFDELYAAVGGAGTGDLVSTNNLSDLDDIPTARANLEVYSTSEVDAAIAGGGAAPTECIIVALGDETTAITAGTAKVTIHAPYDLTLTDVWAGLTTVSSSGAVTVDVNDAGSSIFSTNPSIDASEETSLTGTAGVISGTTHFLSKGDKLTFDVDAAGTGAKGLKVYLIGHQ